MSEKRKNDERQVEWSGDFGQGYGLMKIAGILMILALLFSAKSAWWLIFPLMWFVWGGKGWGMRCGSGHAHGCDGNEYPREKRKNDQIV